MALIGVGLDIVFATGDAFFARLINSCKVSSDASDSILKEMLIPWYPGFTFSSNWRNPKRSISPSSVDSIESILMPLAAACATKLVVIHPANPARRYSTGFAPLSVPKRSGTSSFTNVWGLSLVWVSHAP